MKKIMKRQAPMIILTSLSAILYALLSVLVAVVLQTVVDSATTQDFPRFISILIGSVVFVVLLSVVYYLSCNFKNCLSRNIIKEVRGKMFAGILRQNYHDYQSVDTADYISAMTNDIRMLEDTYIDLALKLIKNTVMFLATLVLLLTYNYIVTIYLIVMLAAMMTIPNMLGKRLQNRQSRLSNQLTEFVSKMKDFFHAFGVIKSFNMVPLIQKKFDIENKETAQVKFQKDQMSAITDSVACLLSSLMQFSIVFVGAFLIIKNRMTMGTLVALIQLSSMFTSPISQIMDNYSTLKSAKPIIDKIDAISSYQDSAFTASLPASFNNTITLRNVSFSYAQGNEALKDISLNIERCKKYAIVGPSGCGKTTLIKLIAGYYSNYTGSISFDNRELHTLDTNTLGQVLSLIHQNVYMFGSSIRDNITLFAKLDAFYLESVLNVNGVNLFLGDGYRGLDAQIGENGNQLSGGQRQRIAVARALFQKSPILILDEGTSSLDNQTGYDIEKSILGLDGQTVITITHNLNQDLLQKYDQIIMMKDGHIIHASCYEEVKDLLLVAG